MYRRQAHLFSCMLASILTLFLLTAQVVQAAPQATWMIVHSPNTGISDGLNGVVVISTNDVWAVGCGGNGDALIEQWNGSNWSIVMGPTTFCSLNGISRVPGKNNLWAVGNPSGQTLTEFYG